MHFNPFRSLSVCNFFFFLSELILAVAQTTFGLLCVNPYYGQSVRIHATLTQTLAISGC